MAVGLAEGEARLGIERQEVIRLAQGEYNAFPALAVTPGGEVLVAFVRLHDGRESIWLRKARSPVAILEAARQVSEGHRAWHPRLAAGSDGKVWLAWSGLTGRPRRGSHDREVFLRRVHPGRPGPVIRVSGPDGRAADPELAAGPDGRVHLVWEQSASDRMHQVRIAYRAASPGGRLIAKTEIISPGPFDRRPTVALSGRTVQVAWDSLVDREVTGAADPDYDVFMRSRLDLGWEGVLTVDSRPGIQAAPALAVDREGCLLVAYHSSHRHALVKWWELRRVCGQKVERLKALDPVGESEPFGEQQGAEFPDLARWPDGRLAVVSRPSQGAYLQLIDGNGVSRPLDLTRQGWGARGTRAQAAVGPEGTLLLVRRARHGCVLERFLTRSEPAGPPVFGSLKSLGTKPADPGARPRSRGALYGDLHMHSAASDGTGPPDEIYARAWARGLNFAALTDHDYIVGSPRFPSRFDEIAWVTDAFDARENFSTLHAYEWTTKTVPQGGGHRNVYFRGPAPVQICSSKSDCPDSASLFRTLRKEPAIAIPHHTSWTGTDWDTAEPDIQTQFEMVSVHGACETPGDQAIPSRGNLKGMYAVDGLRRGLKFGFVGGSDAHGLRWHHGIGRAWDPWTLGLTGLKIEQGQPENTRQAIFDAIRARRTFATSGRMWPLSLKVNEGTRVFVFESSGYDRVDLLRDGEMIHSEKASTLGHVGQFTDSQAGPGTHFYYLRATAGQGPELIGVAWTSPVFVTVPGKESNE